MNPMLVGQNLLQQYLAVGDFLGFLQAVFTSSMGVLFYGLIILFATLPLYLRTQSLTFVAILAIILSTLMYAMIPIAGQRILGLVLVLTVGGVITYLFTRGT